MKKVYIDFETRSKVDIKTSGSWIYTKDPSTSILCIGFAVEDDSPIVITFSELNDYLELGYPHENLSYLRKMSKDPNTIFIAHNAFFEKAVWKHIMVPQFDFPEIPIERWKCTMAKCAVYTLPFKLESAARVLGLENQKDMKGSSMMLRLSKPRVPTKNNPSIWDENPEKLRILYKYCHFDILATRELDQTLKDLSDKETKVWELDQRINERGIKIDTPAVEKAIKIMDFYNELRLKEFKKVTDYYVDSPKQVKKLVEWLNANGVDCYNAKKETVEELLEDKSIAEKPRRALEIRSELSKSSVAKYESMSCRVDVDSRCRELFAYHGASTGRWAGRGIQPQNFPRGDKDIDETLEFLKLAEPQTFIQHYPYTLNTLSNSLRGMIISEKDKDLICADFNAIETRVLAWLTGEEKLLNCFKTGKDPYIDMASKIFNKPIESITSEERQVGKSAVLGCGYQMGYKRFTTQYKVEEDLASKAVETYRSTYSLIKRFWYDVENSAVKAVRTGCSNICGRVVFGVSKNKKLLVCKLPSGRNLLYQNPRIKTSKPTEGSTNFFKDKEALVFDGVDSTTKQWCETFTYGGMLTENIVQAIARDLLAEAMLNLEQSGYPVVMTSHDEIVSEIPTNFGSLDDFISIMTSPPEWGKDIPLKAEGWRGKRYRK